MDSRVTMALAGVLFVGALLAGYWGLTMSRGSEPVNANSSSQILSSDATVADNTNVRVVAARDIAAYSALTREDLKVENVNQREAGESSDLESLLGKTVWTSISSGKAINETMLEPGGALSSMIRPHERAVAVGVDEVIAAGGHLAPGDFVDVLVYLRANGNNEGEQDSAQVVIPAARLLSYGALLGPHAGSYKKPVKEDEQEAPEVNPGQIRSAVVAIPAELINKFMLASQAGHVRLAVRSKQEKLHEHFERGELRVVTQPPSRALLSELTGVEPVPRGTPQINAQPISAPISPRPVASTRSAVPRPTPASIEVIRGTQRQQINP